MGKNDEDKQLWQTYAKQVKRVKTKQPAPVVKTPAKKIRIKPQPVIIRPAVPAKNLHPPSEITLEKSREKKLRQGTITLDGKLDLHGMTQPEAQQALQKFILHHAARQARHLLVITGKGSIKQGEAVSGILRRNLPLWCADPTLASLILALRPAAPSDGGTGAYYVILRRRKD